MRKYGLRSDAGGDFVLRAVQTEHRLSEDGVTFHLVIALMMDDDVLTALDSATSEDPRERGVAMRVLTTPWTGSAAMADQSHARPEIRVEAAVAAGPTRGPTSLRSPRCCRQTSGPSSAV